MPERVLIIFLSSHTHSIESYHHQTTSCLLSMQTSDSSSSSSSTSSFHLLSLLLKCAELISTNHPTSASDLLPELFELSSPFGTPFHRVAAFFTHSLRHHLILRCLPRHPSPPPPLLHSLCLSLKLPSFHSALHSFNSLTPFIKFSHFTSNQAIFHAVLGHPRLHIIDLDIMQGLQWPALFHILSSSSSCLPSIRVTAFGPSSKLLAQTGTRLAEFAHSLGLPFQYDPIEGKIGNMSSFIQQPSRHDDDDDEFTVVHCVHHRLYDVVGCSAGEMMKVLRVVRPRLVTVVEQDLEVTSHCGSFLDKFVEALHYYSALFDAVGEGLLGRDTVQRYEVEHQLFGTEINNILAVDGKINGGGCDDDLVAGRWGHELVRAGFEPFSLSGSPAAQAGLLLEMFPWKGYTLMEENGCLRLGWKDLPLLTASAWQPSSTFSDIFSDRQQL